MKVKISVPTLIEKVEAKKAALQREYDEAVDAFPAQQDEYRRKLINALERALNRAIDGKPFPEPYSRYRRDSYVDGAIIDVNAKQPSKPTKPDVKRLNARLKELRLTSETELRVDPWDGDWRGIL